MKKLLSLLVCCLAAVVFVGCGPDGPSHSIEAKTGGVLNVSLTSAEISGKIVLPKVTSANLSFGVLYSTNSGVLMGSAKQIQATTFDSDYSFTVSINDLEPGTRYYYRSYLLQNDEVIYGETESFETLAISSMIRTEEVVNIGLSTVTVKAFLDLPDDFSYDAYYGFRFEADGHALIRIVSNNLRGNYYSALGSNLESNVKYKVSAFVVGSGQEYVAEGIEFTTRALTPGPVDMGLSVKWGDCNIGAIAPYEDGAYYAWGETNTKSCYDLSTYSMCNGSIYTMTKYCLSSTFGVVDGKSTLEKEDDVAAQTLSGKWRMPTKNEWEELLAPINCYCTWTEYKVQTSSGWGYVQGFVITSKKTNNSIFLPFAGYYQEDCLLAHAGKGCYWNSSVSESSFIAGLTQINETESKVGYWIRYEGCSVRPVYDDND